MSSVHLPSIPTDQRLYAIGDIHGRLDLLQQLMTMIVADAAEHQTLQTIIVFLGDYVDRGVNSRGVIDFLIHQLPENFTPIFLRGNHEEKMMEFLAGDMRNANAWMMFGGPATLASYGIHYQRTGLMQGLFTLQEDLLKKMPRGHLDFLNNTLFEYTCGDYCFVHAGVRPGVPLTEQTNADRLWIRHEFLSSTADHGKIIVHGHSISPEIDIQSNRIGIDTGAYATGRLTALILHGAERKWLTT